MLIPQRAYGYVPGAERRHGLEVAPFQEMVTKTGGGSLVSTAGDLHRFLRAFYREDVLRSATWRTLFPPRDSTVAFQGRCPGFNLYMERDLAHDIDVIVLANNYAAGMVADVGDALAKLARGEGVAPPPWKGDLAADSLAVRRWLGAYRVPAGSLPYGDGPFVMKWKNGGVVVSNGGAALDFLLPQGAGKYLARNAWSELTVEERGGDPVLALRPLWFTTKPIVLERISPGH
jgi:hypothetical protein